MTCNCEMVATWLSAILLAFLFAECEAITVHQCARCSTLKDSRHLFFEERVHIVNSSLKHSRVVLCNYLKQILGHFKALRSFAISTFASTASSPTFTASINCKCAKPNPIHISLYQHVTLTRSYCEHTRKNHKEKAKNDNWQQAGMIFVKKKA